MPVRKRQEVQKMLRSLVLAAALISCASAAIWPEQLGKFHRRSVKPHALDGAMESEYGFEEMEEADYGSFKVAASRYKDSTGAFAAGLTKPARPQQTGNFLITCSGKCPKSLAKDLEALPGLTRAPLPSIGGYLPVKNRIAQSERYILGPTGLRESAPQIPASVVAFEFGTEGEIARYRAANGEATVAIFAYPTPQMARKQSNAFEALPGAVVKRAGPMLAVAFSTDRAIGQNLLSQLNYNASVAWQDPAPLVLRPETAGQMLLSIITLAGIVLSFCVLSGVAFGTFRVLARKFGIWDADDALTTLQLSGK